MVSPARSVHAAILVGTVALLFPVVADPTPASGQVIPIRTVPVASAEPFLVFPADRLGMGGVSIALDDTLGDPFSNPAALLRLSGPRLFSAPAGYAISGGNGGALTLPVGGFLGGSSWRGGVAVALQELDRGRVWRDVSLIDPVVPRPHALSRQSSTNLYGFAALGRALGERGRTAIGVSATVAGLSAVPGVDLLFDEEVLDQGGHTLDLRAGLVTELGTEDVVEAVLVHHRTDLEYELFGQVWIQAEDPALPPEQWPWEPVAFRRTEPDRSRTWGLQLRYTRPLEPEGWRLGGVLTANYRTHPEIPNYTSMSIPRDPGESWAYDLGVGLSHRNGAAVFALDVVYEPIWTETWADAATPLRTASGRLIPTGDMTVFNDFRFHNAILRMGASGGSDVVDLQLGLDLRAYRYTLEQTDFLAERKRRQREDWVEWTPTLGLALRLGALSLRYTGRATLGTGLPGVAPPWWEARGFAAPTTSDYLPAPSATLTLEDEVVHAHQVAVEIRVGG